MSVDCAYCNDEGYCPYCGKPHRESKGIEVEAHDTGRGRIDLEIGGSRYTIIEPHGIVAGRYRLIPIEGEK